MAEEERNKMLPDDKSKRLDAYADQGSSAPHRNLSDPGDPTPEDPEIRKKLEGMLHFII